MPSPFVPVTAPLCGDLQRAYAVVVAVKFLARSVDAEGVLNLLTWEGYADASFVQPFEATTGCKVTATLVGSKDDYISAKSASRSDLKDCFAIDEHKKNIT